MQEEKRINPICLRLSLLIAQLELRQDEFAYLINTAKSTVSSWLSGVRNPSRRNLERVIDATGVNPAWLTEGVGEQWLDRVVPTKEELFANREEWDEINRSTPRHELWRLGSIDRDKAELRSRIRKPRRIFMFGEMKYSKNLQERLLDQKDTHYNNLIEELKERLADKDRQLADKDKRLEDQLADKDKRLEDKDKLIERLDKEIETLEEEREKLRKELDRCLGAELA